jgi:nitroreductase/dihydropteridine reductase
LINDGFNLLNLTVLATVLEYCVSDAIASRNRVAFVELNTGEDGDTSAWTKAQTYLALGNTMHTLARLNIDSTPMEGIDTDLVSKEFAVELDGYVTDVALAIGYRDAENDYNIAPPKSRLAMADVIVKL